MKQANWPAGDNGLAGLADERTGGRATGKDLSPSHPSAGQPVLRARQRVVPVSQSAALLALSSVALCEGRA